MPVKTLPPGKVSWYQSAGRSCRRSAMLDPTMTTGGFLLV